MTEKEKSQGFSLKEKTACLIGCGGLGCNIAVHLAGAGIGKLFLCDFDMVSASNLNRQFLYTKEDIGKSKCKRAKEKLSLYSDECEFIAIEKKIKSKTDLSFAKDCDIILLAVDNAEGRIAAEKFALENKIPLVTGGIDGFYGMAYLYIPNTSPCTFCAGLRENSDIKNNVSSVAGIIGSAEAALATEYLLTQNSELGGNLLIYDEGRFHTLKISSSKECSTCNSNIN